MHYGRQRGFFAGITPVVKYLILINSGIFVLELLFRLNWASYLGLIPVDFWRGRLWQAVTYMFLHGGIFHLFFNMLVLWMFGTTLESIWGPRRFITFYFICGIGAGLLSAVATPASQAATVGASGAIYGLLMAFGILFPRQLIYIWGIFPVQARYFVIGLGLVEFLSAVGTSGSGIAHFAHLGGMLFGLVYMRWGEWRKTVSALRGEKRRTRHIKVVWDRERERQKLQQEIDRLLDKIGKSGIDSLTKEEDELFREASRKMEDLENRR